MIRFFFRFLSTVSLAVAVVMAVLDATRTLASSALVMTPLATSWTAMSPDTLQSTRLFVEGKLHPLVWDPIVASILSLPGFAVFAILSLILFVIGRKPPPRAGDLVVEG